MFYRSDSFIFRSYRNKNKPIQKSKRIELKIKGLIITLAINCFGIILIESHIGTMIIFTSFLIAILMLAAIIKGKRGDICGRV